VALASWSNGISQILTGRTDYDREISTDRVIGGVDGASVYAYVAPAPLPVYRPANERLPSQMPQFSADDYLDVYGNTVNPDLVPTDERVGNTEETDGMVLAAAVSAPATTDPNDFIVVQAAILDQMRRTEAPAVKSDVADSPEPVSGEAPFPNTPVRAADGA
jgi:hypothetical protein